MCRDCLCLLAGLSLSEALEKDSEETVLLEIVPAITPDSNLLKAEFNEDGSVNSRFDSGCVQRLSLFAGGFISLGPRKRILKGQFFLKLCWLSPQMAIYLKPILLRAAA